MAQQISSEPGVVFERRPAGSMYLKGAKRSIHCLWLLVVGALILANIQNLDAESLASKNKKGNRLFAQGKYEDAERVYLDAQVSSPGRSEILYNLGNSLIKQKKYNEGIQALGQSADKGNNRIKENSWFNSGDALFLMGNYKDSAQAFIQALRLDPDDEDAKHNLELALKKLNEQKQGKSDQNRNQGSPENPGRNRSKDRERNSNQPDDKKAGGSGKPDESTKPESSQMASPSQQKGSISREQALRILDAVQSRELENQRRMLEDRARRKSAGKDW
jgi:Ca-activated chloride channel family protein